MESARRLYTNMENHAPKANKKGPFFTLPASGWIGRASCSRSTVCPQEPFHDLTNKRGFKCENEMHTSKSVAGDGRNDALFRVVCHHILNHDRDAEVVLLEVDPRRRSLEVAIGENLLPFQH